MLEVRLIGKFDIKYGGKPVNISSRAAQSLFAYLILNAGTSHRREKLAGMFWADAAEEKARAYLRHELWRIRNALPSSKFLLSDDLGITFDSSVDYWLDTDALEKLMDAASADELMVALSIYQGELLPGFYEDWIVLEREHLQAVYEQKMARLLELLESEKRWPEILEWAERWISLGQRSESPYRALISAYDAIGDRAKVASTYERCVQALRELDLEPSEQTRALAFKRTPRLNIPIPLTSFIGRESELKEIANLLSKYRLITLTGSGGVGKTRLAIQVVGDVLDRFPDGVCFLDLAPLSDPALVPDTLASVLDLHEPGDDKLSFTDLLINYFRSRSVLIIFDNCEHLIESCAHLVDSLLTTCKDVSILTTSREALRVSGEISYRVRSLQMPRPESESAVDALTSIESVRLFTERAKVIAPGFVLGPQNAKVIARICQRLDGIPLAIELAAARVNVLTVDQILSRLDDRFNLLTRGSRVALPHHQTLRATIEWSYGLLSEPERILFSRLAVFKGGWTLEATEAVCSQVELSQNNILDLLDRLVERSLVFLELTSAHNEMRFVMLETIREYALGKLMSSGEMKIIALRHLTFFAEVVDEAERNLKGPDQAVWYKHLDNELDNLRTALTWFEGIENTEIRLRFAAGLWRYWKSRGKISEGRGYLRRILEGLPPGPSRQTLACARALTAAGSLAYYEADFSYSEESRKEALAIFRNLDNKVGIADCLNGLGNTAISQADYDSARAFYEESLIIRKELWDKWGVARLLGNLGLLAFLQANYSQARSLHLESLALFRELRDQEGIANELVNLGDVARRQGQLSTASSLYEESAAIARELNDQWGLAYAFMGIADVMLAQGNFSRASSLYKECLMIFQKGEDYMGIPFALESVAALELVKNQPEKAARLFGAADALRKSTHSPLPHPDLSTFQKNLSLLHQQLNLSKFEVAWKEGCAMMSDQAIALALECVNE